MKTIFLVKKSGTDWPIGGVVISSPLRMIKATSGQKSILACAAVLAWAAIEGTGWDFQLNWLIPPGDSVGDMSNGVIRMDQPIVKKIYKQKSDGLNGAATEATMAQDKSSIYMAANCRPRVNKPINSMD